ncbi:MAG: hypothetical protein ACRCSV_04495 [Chlamydiales bacterium]
MKRIDFRDLQKYLHEVPNLAHSDDLLKKIHSMDTHTAYALLGGYLAPLMRTGTKETTTPKLLHLEELVQANVGEIANANLKNIRDSKLPELEEKIKKILAKFKEYQKKLSGINGWIDGDGHYRIAMQYREVYNMYKELFALIEDVRHIIDKEDPRKWQLHPELRKKYTELLSVFGGAIQPWEGDKTRGVLPPEHTRFLIKDIEEALKGIYENREEQEDRAIKDLQDRLDKLTKDKDTKIGDLDKQVKDLTRDEKTNKDRITSLEKQIRDLESEKTKDKNKLLEKDREINRLKEQISNLTADKTKNEKLIAELKEQIKKLTKQVSDLSGDKIGNKKTIDELKEQIKKLNEQIDTLKGQKDKNTATIAELRGKITQLEREKSEKDTEISNLKKELQKVKDDLIKVTNEKKTTNQELQRQIKAKDIEIGKLKEQIAALKQKIKDQDALEKQITDLQREKEELERTKGGEITNLKEKLADLDKRIRELEKLKEAEITALQKDLQKVKDDLKIKEKEIKDNKIDEVAKELPDLKKILEDLKREGIDPKDLSKLRDKLDDLNRLTKDGKDAVKDIGDLQKDIQALRDELAKQKLKELEKREKEKEIEDREKKLDNLQREILKLRRELGDLENLKGKDLKDLRDKLEKLEELKGKVGDSDDKIKSLQDEINKLRRELLKENREEIDKQTKLKEKEEEIKKKEEEIKLKELKEIELKELKEKQEMMDAYVFMIVVFLTQLHTKQAEKLKVHGETLKKISRIFDQWNVIQQGLNTISRNAKTILQWIKEKKVDSDYNLYTDNTLTKRETDSRKLAIWNTLKNFIPNLNQKVRELRRILDEVKKDLPSSAKSLLDTMYKLSTRILDIPETKGDSDLTSYLKVVTKSANELRISQEIEDLKNSNKELLKKADALTDERKSIRDDVGETRWGLTDGALKFFWPSYYKKKQKWNELGAERDGIYKEIDANKKKISEKESELRQKVREKIALPDKRLTILQWISDSDQSKFKSYVDNIAQGITALTSISNMAQQQLQIDTQYYNSLLGLQKSGFDSLTRTIQGIVSNLR